MGCSMTLVADGLGRRCSGEGRHSGEEEARAARGRLDPEWPDLPRPDPGARQRGAAAATRGRGRAQRSSVLGSHGGGGSRGWGDGRRGFRGGAASLWGGGGAQRGARRRGS